MDRSRIPEFYKHSVKDRLGLLRGAQYHQRQEDYRMLTRWPARLLRLCTTPIK